MDYKKKIEKAISDFQAQKKRDEESRQVNQGETLAEYHDGLNSAVVLGVQSTDRSKQTGKQTLMDEFDQFVLHDEMQKKMNEVLGKNSTQPSSSLNISNPEDGSSDNRDIQQTKEAFDEPTSRLSGAEMDIDEAGNTTAVGEEELVISTDEEGEEEKVDNGDEEYMFPTPDEINRASPPVVGMVFSKLEEAVRFVNIYGQLQGFAVIKGRNYKQRKIFLVCNKARKTVSKVKGTRKRNRRALERTGCLMSVTVSLVDGKWHITSCNLEHNHDLVPSPSLTKFFLSHQTMTEEEVMLSKLLQEMRIKPRGIMTIFRKLRGNFGNIMFGTRSLDNLKQGERNRKRNSDIECTLKYIEKIQLDKPGFCYKMEVDSLGAVRSIFWTDARSLLDYKLYGDIISFDTTYSTNKYNMPFAPIIGINGHGRTIVFGWALLKNQTAETFKWLFETLVAVMDGKKPTIVLTDQDKAMKRAVPWVFPDAFHRWCIWHVLRKMREHLAFYMSTREGMEKEIMRLIMQSITVAEFEEGWKQMEITYECAAHDHIIRMWKKRSMYVPAYFHGNFCPFTKATSRSESFNSNFKEYVRRKDSIETFLKQYELFNENIVEIENKDRFESTQKIPMFWCRQPIERHAAEIYTKGIYDKFLVELLNSTAFGVAEVEKDKLYKMNKLFRYDDPEFWRDSFTVNVDWAMMKFECECGKFARDGLLCCHILRLFTQFDVTKIPQHYIVPRWTSEFRENELLRYKKESIQVYGNSSSQNALRYAMLMNSLSDVCSDISRDQSKCQEFIEEVHKLHAKLMSEGATANKETVVLRDPPVIKSKATKKSDVTPAAGSASGSNSVAAAVQQDNPEEFINISNFDSVPRINVNETVQDSSMHATDPVVQVTESRFDMLKGKGSQTVKAGAPANLVDPPVSNSASVVKGKRMKPQSEKKSNKKKQDKKNTCSAGPAAKGL